MSQVSVIHLAIYKSEVATKLLYCSEAQFQIVFCDVDLQGPKLTP